MNEFGFLKLVRQKGEYGSEREASRAVGSVFSTIKSWLPVAASEKLRRTLPQDASQLWSFAPLEFKNAAGRLSGARAGALQFVLGVHRRAATVLPTAPSGQPSRFLPP